MKRTLDIVLAGAGLLVGGPVLLALAAAVKLDTPGPAFFHQTRVGRDKRRIRVAKLRTMVVNAEQLGTQVTAAGDPRVTRVGALLRKTKLDELPQLWNVLTGDMSLVGPRPEVEYYVQRYRPEWERVFEVRPGLTDLASLVFRDEERLLALAGDRERAYTEVLMPMKLELAIEGIARSSVRDDLRVMLQTVMSVLGRPDSRTTAILAEARSRIAKLESPRS